MELEERKIYEEEETTNDDLGAALIVIGGVLLGGCGFIGLFLMNDIVDGHFFIFTWSGIQSTLAIILIAVGVYKKMKAHVKDDA